MRILVTGASGFVGRRFVEMYSGRHDLFALVRSPGPDLAGVEWIVHDLVDPLDEAGLPERLDAVAHLAQSRRYRDFPDGARDVFDVNVRSTLGLLEYARLAGARSFVFTSSGGVYGYSYERFAETEPVSPLNFYLSSKYSAELLIANYQRFFSTVVLRPFFVYGPGQDRMLIPTLIDRVTAGEVVTVEGARGLRITPTYVDDVVRALEPALHFSGAGLFNVAGDEAVTITELVELIGVATGREPRVEHAPQESGGDLLGDNTQMREVLGVVPEVDLRDGLARTIASRLSTA
ncbi:MAG: NAD-dependent epimerase/dehydratase family protein [Gaiellaceae bacterium]|jgi:UDP-glucose 4-epimerase